jgi:hypothetical protein
LQRVTALIELEQQRYHLKAPGDHGHKNADEHKRAEYVQRPAPRDRRDLEESVDANMRLLPGDRNRTDVNAEDHHEQHALLGPGERRTEEITADDIRRVHRDDEQERGGGKREAVASNARR